MSAEELKGKTYDELSKILLGYRQESFNMRLQISAGQFSNMSRKKHVRRNIARVKTIMTQVKNSSLRSKANVE